MPSLVIKDLPKAVHDQLKREAKRNRRSVTQEAIYSLERVYRKPVPIEFFEPIKPLKPIERDETRKIIRRMRDGL